MPSSRLHDASDASADGFLRPDPPPWVVRAIGWALLAIALAALLFILLVPLPESVLCRFVLEPRNGADPIQAPFSGTLEEVRARPGETVTAGAVLFTVRSGEIREGRRLLAEAEEELRSRSIRAMQSEQEYRLQVSEKTVALAHVAREIGILEPALATQTGLLRSFEENPQSVSRTELVEMRLETADRERDLALARAKQESLQVARDTLEQIWARTRLEQESGIVLWEARRAAALRLLEGTEGDIAVVRAPHDGVIMSVARSQTGTVVQTGEELMRLAATGATLHVRLNLPERGLGKVEEGQAVRLFFEAYPYQRFGTVDALLSWVSPAALVADAAGGAGTEGTQFVAFAEIEEWSPLPPRRLKLRPGLAGEARVRVGRQTIAQSAFAPLRGLAERLR